MKNRYVEKAKKSLTPIFEKINTVLNKETFIRTGKRKITVKPFKLAICIIAIIVIISIIISVISSFSGNKVIEIPFEIGNEYKTVSSENDVILYNNKCVMKVTSDGKVLWNISQPLSEPQVESSGKFTLIYDLSGNHYAASYKNDKKICEYKVGSDIISAKITKSGNAVISSDTDGYKAKATIYNKSGKETYVWNSYSGYITDVDITDNGRYLAVAQLVTDNKKADSKIQFIDTARGEVIGTVDKPDEAIAKVKFSSSDKLTVVTDTHISGYNKSGKQLYDISLIGKNPSLFNVTDGDMFAVVTTDNRGNSVLELYTTSGKFKGSYTASGKIKALTVCKTNAVIAEQNGITRVNGSGKVKKTLKPGHDVKDICYFGNGKQIVVVGSSQAETVKVK